MLLLPFISHFLALSQATLSMPQMAAAQQLLGQPQVPQLLVAAPQQSSASGVQQILIPISTGKKHCKVSDRVNMAMLNS